MCKLFIFLNCAKMQKYLKNSKFLNNDGHFRIPHHKISLKQFSNICKNVVKFLLLCIGVEKWWRIFAKQWNLKKIKNGNFSFFYILQLPHTVMSNSEKLTLPKIVYYTYCVYDTAHIICSNLDRLGSLVFMRIFGTKCLRCIGLDCRSKGYTEFYNALHRTWLQVQGLHWIYNIVNWYFIILYLYLKWWAYLN